MSERATTEVEALEGTTERDPGEFPRTTVQKKLVFNEQKSDEGDVLLKISLLHATYFSDFGAIQQKNFWLSRARHPERVEYIVAMDVDDSSAIEITAQEKRAVNKPIDGFSTAVQNWNSAAFISDGDLLFVISDDLKPHHDWDVRLEEMLGSLNPAQVDFAVKVQDSPNPSDTTLRHPVISRKFYSKFGLFDNSFRGVFCDNDITLRALLYSRILDGRSAIFEHEHPHFDRQVHLTLSQHKINRLEEYAFGREVFERAYAPFHKGLNLNNLSLPTDHTNLAPSLRIRRLGINFKRKGNRSTDSGTYRVGNL